MNIKNKNDYISLKKELRFNSSDYQDTQVVDMTQKAVDYAYDNLKEPENIYEGYDIEFEAEITDIALSIDAHLQKNKKNKNHNLRHQERPVRFQSTRIIPGFSLSAFWEKLKNTQRTTSFSPLQTI